MSAMRFVEFSSIAYSKYGRPMERNSGVKATLDSSGSERLPASSNRPSVFAASLQCTTEARGTPSRCLPQKKGEMIGKGSQQ